MRSIRIDDRLDAAAPIDLVGGHELPGQEHALREEWAAQPLGMADAAEHTDVDLGQGEARLGRRDDEIARRDDRHAGADALAVHLGDHREPALVDRIEAVARAMRPGSTWSRASPCGAPSSGRPSGRCRRGESCRSTPPQNSFDVRRRAQHDHRCLPAGTQRLHRRGDLLERLVGEGIHRRAVERDHRHPVLDVDADVVHPMSLRCC